MEGDAEGGVRGFAWEFLGEEKREGRGGRMKDGGIEGKQREFVNGDERKGEKGRKRKRKKIGK